MPFLPAPKPPKCSRVAKLRAQMERQNQRARESAIRYREKLEAERREALAEGPGFRLVPATNPERRARLHEGGFGDYADRIRNLDCVVPGCPDPAEACHAKSRGAGGTKRDLFPCCHAHHMEQHTLGIQTWQAKYGLDLPAITDHLWRILGDASRAGISSARTAAVSAGPRLTSTRDSGS